MSDWDVHLIFVKGSSNKFWRARTEDVATTNVSTLSAIAVTELRRYV